MTIASTRLTHKVFAMAPPIVLLVMVPGFRSYRRERSGY